MTNGIDNYLRYVAENNSPNQYEVTGTDFRGKRFKPIKTPNIIHALSINLMRGSVWHIIDGKRKLIKRVP